MIQRIAYLVVLLCLGLALSLNAEAASARTRQTIDRGWKFFRGNETRASDPTFDDHHWQDINLPHSFSEPYFRSPDFYIGYGWYRKHVLIDAAASNRKESLEFEGVSQIAEVWVNGIKVGGHEGGYTGFALDVSKAMKVGDNVIAIRVNNLWNAQLNPRAGEHVFSGGIYRDVYLLETAPTHVTWYGTFVTTPKVSSDAATVDVKTEIKNDSNEVKTARLRTTVLDPLGKTVAEYSSVARLVAGGVVTVDQTGALHNPSLWSPETPAMYTAVSRVYVRGTLQDEYRTRFGIRWFTWTAENGLTFNGKHRYFHGADVHQDHAG